jgi:hypothetical protein
MRQNRRYVFVPELVCYIEQPEEQGILHKPATYEVLKEALFKIQVVWDGFVVAIVADSRKDRTASL